MAGRLVVINGARHAPWRQGSHTATTGQCIFWRTFRRHKFFFFFLFLVYPVEEPFHEFMVWHLAQAIIFRSFSERHFSARLPSHPQRRWRGTPRDCCGFGEDRVLELGKLAHDRSAAIYSASHRIIVKQKYFVCRGCGAATAAIFVCVSRGGEGRDQYCSPARVGAPPHSVYDRRTWPTFVSQSKPNYKMLASERGDR